MNAGHRNPSAVPVGDVCAGTDLPHIESLLNALQIVLEPVGHQDRPAVCAFDQVLQRVQLPLVEEQAVVLSVIDAAIGQLAQLPGQRRRAHRVDLRAPQGNHQFMLQLFVGAAFLPGQLHGHTV